jgi:hypothetical protein
MFGMMADHFVDINLLFGANPGLSPQRGTRVILIFQRVKIKT